MEQESQATEMCLLLGVTACLRQAFTATLSCSERLQTQHLTRQLSFCRARRLVPSGRAGPALSAFVLFRGEGSPSMFLAC